MKQYHISWVDQIVDIDACMNPESIKGINIYGCTLTNAHALSKFSNLEHFTIINSKADVTLIIPATKYAIIKQCTDMNCPNKFDGRLKYLEIKCNDIINISPIVIGLTNLTVLSLANNLIEDISPLKTLIKLTDLDCDHNRISDVGPLQYLTELNHLRLYNNRITDVSPLYSLEKLELLDLGENQITEISANKWDLLQDLDISRNPITDISNIAKQYLEELNCNSSSVSDLSPLLKCHLLWNLNIPAGLHKSKELRQILHFGKLRRNYIDGANIYNTEDSQACEKTAMICRTIQRSVQYLENTVKFDYIRMIRDENFNLYKSHIYDNGDDTVIHCFELVYARILQESNEETKQELFKILMHEIIDSEGSCHTELSARLINVLGGFDEQIQVQISHQDQIFAIITNEKDKLEKEDNYNEEIHIVNVTKLLRKLYTDEIMITEWINAIHEWNKPF